MKEIRKGLKKQLVEKETPEKLKKKAKNKWIIQSRHYIDDVWMLRLYSLKRSAWSEWRNMSSYKSEKDMLKAYKDVLKKQKNASGIFKRILDKYEYRIKE